MTAHLQHIRVFSLSQENEILMNLFTHIRHSGRNEEKWNFIFIFPTSTSFSRIIFRCSFPPFPLPQKNKHKKRVELHSCKYLEKQMSTVTRKQRKRMKKFATRKNSNNFHFVDFFVHSIIWRWKEGRRSEALETVSSERDDNFEEVALKMMNFFLTHRTKISTARAKTRSQTFSYLQTRRRICR